MMTRRRPEGGAGADQHHQSLKVIVRAILLLASILSGPIAALAQTAAPPLVLDAKIPLGQISGRIDHLAVDLKRQRLFVAELGNDSLGVVDLAAGKVARTIADFCEPQGVAYVPFADSVYVANATDGSVRVLRGDNLAPVGRIELGDDADNVRVDEPHHRVLVGYGSGALAIIDPATRTKAGDIRLKGHPEGFRIDETGTQVFVNVPDAREITVVDLAAAGTRSLPQGMRANFPMAIDRDTHRVLVVSRGPPTLMALSSQDGHVVAKIATCSDADDLFVDARRRRVYVSCGAGVIDIFAAEEAGYRRLARVPTVSGARTSLFVPERERFYLAVRARGSEPAAIWVFRPTP
jgi:DNA-binding beta-propeller fold protein YncE